MNLASYAGVEFPSTGPSALPDTGGPAQPLLMVRGLCKRARAGDDGVEPLDGVSFEVAKGEMLALVGEPGCGLRTLPRLLARLIPADAGELIFDGLGVEQFGGMKLKDFRRGLQMVFADTPTSLNPHLTLVEAIAYGPRVQGLLPRQALQRARAVLADVGLAPGLFAQRYPHELTGVQRQRVGIARALALQPRLLVLDRLEAGLDGPEQTQLLQLLQQLKAQRGLSCLFFSHDLQAMQRVADRVGVLDRGQLIEIGPAAALFAGARHPRTRALLSTVSGTNPLRPSSSTARAADVPEPGYPSGGCRFRDLCPLARQVCELRVPPMRVSTAGHVAACHFDTALPVAQPYPMPATS